MSEKKAIKVSVIVPVYQSETFLKQCLDSLRNQTLKEIEIICVDDGSEDQSVLILQSIAKEDSRVRFYNQEHKGAGAARNQGMKKAEGEYLTFIDADDFANPEMLERLYERASETKADVVVCKASCWHEDLQIYTDLPGAMREELVPEKEVFNRKDMPEGILNAFHNWPWNKLYRRAFIEENHLTFQEIFRTNDLYFTCRALVLAERIALVREYLINYRVGTGKSSQDTNKSYPLAFYEAFLALQDFLKQQGLYEELKKSFVNHALDGCMANLCSLEGSEQQEMLFDRLKEEIFARLDICDQPQESYHTYNIEAFRMSRLVKEVSYGAYLRYRVAQLKEERDGIIRSDLIRIDETRRRSEEEGLHRGREEGYQTGLQTGRQEGHKEGHEEGLQDGLTEGHRQGFDEGWKQAEEYVKASFTWKVGRVISFPARLIKKLS